MSAISPKLGKNSSWFHVYWAIPWLPGVQLFEEFTLIRRTTLQVHVMVLLRVVKEPVMIFLCHEKKALFINRRISRLCDGYIAHSKQMDWSFCVDSSILWILITMVLSHPLVETKSLPGALPSVKKVRFSSLSYRPWCPFTCSQYHPAAKWPPQFGLWYNSA